MDDTGETTDNNPEITTIGDPIDTAERRNDDRRQKDEGSPLGVERRQWSDRRKIRSKEGRERYLDPAGIASACERSSGRLVLKNGQLLLMERFIIRSQPRGRPSDPRA